MSESIRVGDLGEAPVIPIMLILAGAYFTWFGVHYWRRDIKWPSDPVKSVLRGKGIPEPGTISSTAAETLTSAQQQSTGGGNIPPTAVDSGNAKSIARMLLPSFGWTSAEFSPLDQLWTRESGWSRTAWNPSGAYGVAQALGHAQSGECAIGPRSVNASQPGLNCAYGSQYGLSPDEARSANAGNAYYQVRWGMGYIRSVYGSPTAAWAHEQQFNYY